MLNFGSQRIYLYPEFVDMRKSFNGLSILVEESFNGKLLAGSYFVFLNKRKTIAKILYWDSDGFAIWSKQLEQGTFKVLKGTKNRISRRDLTLILEGIEPRRMNLRYTQK
jgi:transposase